ncbi:MAG: hypothetical protein AAF870_04560 [Pseudomonadota bacterium]
MSVSRKAINTLILAPLLGMAVLTIQPATYVGDAAYAQNSTNSSASNQGRVSSLSATPSRPSRPSRPSAGGNNGGGASGDRILGRLSKLPPCPPGTPPTPNCRPWTPPVVVAESADECQCKMRRVNGVMMKDCYVLVKKMVHYCKAGHLIRR